MTALTTGTLGTRFALISEAEEEAKMGINTSAMPGRGTDDRLVADHCETHVVDILDVTGGLAFGQIAVLFRLSGNRESSRSRKEKLS
jgi:hypothetical protein